MRAKGVRGVQKTCLCGAREAAACHECAAMSQMGSGLRGEGLGIKSEGMEVTSCPCEHETMPSVNVNKPKLAVMAKIGWTKRPPFEMRSVNRSSQWKHITQLSFLHPLQHLGNGLRLVQLIRQMVIGQ